MLITRPAAQAEGLSSAVAAQGGEAIRFPCVAIEAVEPNHRLTEAPDLVIFTSANAVAHGLRHLNYDAHTRFAAVGRATAAAMQASGLPAPIVPAGEASSEGLLADPHLSLHAGARVCLVRGMGGRGVLPRTLRERGIALDLLEVYRRTRPDYRAEEVAALERRWRTDGIDVVTATSVETYQNLRAILTGSGRELLSETALVLVSERIAAAARALGHRAEIRVAAGPDDDSLVQALCDWAATPRR